MNAIHSLYNTVYDDLTLKTAGIVLGLLLIIAHVIAFLKRDMLNAWLKDFPRNKGVGVIILAIDAIWAWIVVSSMDLGEFASIRGTLQMMVPITFILVINFVDEFLAVRALGVLLLLAACPVLAAAYLEMPFSRLLLPLLAYAWIIVGLFWVGMPYVLRDQLKWVFGSDGRWKGLCAAGAGYGLAVLVCAMLFYSK